MRDQKARHTMQPRLALANGFNGRPPYRPRLAVASPRREPTLTKIFNRASKQPHLSQEKTKISSKMQIQSLRRKLSQPRLTLDYGTMGSVNNSRSPERDRLVSREITRMTNRLDAKKGLAKSQFKSASQGMSM